ncbi:hypothetical protein [Natrinema sp. DC36]|uniref:hypothetical protein n=1 Tax=Natrinema sp. DC36 TaxID=2878680 RepID=UPI001CF095BD|nr:hypothetical protein [Natrinema sp. DC36]
MPTVEKIAGGRVYIRPLDKRFEVGDQADVSDELAAHLCEQRGDFERVGDGVEPLPEPEDLTVDEDETADDADAPDDESDDDDGELDSMDAIEAQLDIDVDDENDTSADSTGDESDRSDADDEDSGVLEGPHRDPEAVADEKCGYFDSDEMDNPCSRGAGWGRDVDDGPCKTHADELEE